MLATPRSHLHASLALTACLVLCSLTLVGCNTESAAPSTDSQIDQSPQAKFDRIVTSLRGDLQSTLETGGGRYTIRDTAGTGTAIVSYEIEAPPKITEPANPGGAPTATITITQTSSYSSLPAAGSEGEDEDKSEEKSSRGMSSMQAEEQLESMGVEVLDPNLMGKDLAEAVEPRLKGPDVTTRSINANTVVKYDLIYEKGRWRMGNPPKADALESTNIALQLALKRQR